MKRNVVNIILALATATVSVLWYMDHVDYNQELKWLKQEHDKAMESFYKRLEKLAETNYYLEKKVADGKKQINETKQQINKIEVVDISTIPPNERADSIRAIINRD